MFAKPFPLALAIALFALPAAAQVPATGYFIAEETCPAFASFRNQTNPGNIATEPSRAYELVGLNKADASHYWIIVPGVEPDHRWVSVTCGTRAEAVDGNKGSGDKPVPTPPRPIPDQPTPLRPAKPNIFSPSAGSRPFAKPGPISPNAKARRRTGSMPAISPCTASGRSRAPMSIAMSPPTRRPPAPTAAGTICRPSNSAPTCAKSSTGSCPAPNRASNGTNGSSTAPAMAPMKRNITPTPWP